MFRLFGKKDKKLSSDKKPVYDQAVILELTLEDGQELGSEDEHTRVFVLEDSLNEELTEDEVMDGHDFGEGLATIYLYGPSADCLFEKIKERLRKSDFNRFEVTLRYGLAEDPESKEKHFTLSW